MPLWTPTKQWAQVLKQTGEGVTYERIPVPKPATDEVLVHIQFTGFCHTDMNAFNGDLPISTKLPLVAGHEGLGIVVACGAKVKDPKEGARVGIMWINRTCLTCAFCLGGEERLCEQAKFTGYTVDGTFQRATSIVKSLSGDRAGAYDAAEYAVVQAAHAVDIPGDVPFEKIAPLLCAGLTAYRAIKDCGARKGNIIAVVGAGGGVGSMALQFAKLKGFRTIAIDTGEQKKKLCQKYGASVFIDFATCEDVIHAVRSETDDGLGAHAVILAADRQEPIQQATEYVRPCGTIVAVGLPPGGQVQASIFTLVLKKITLKGSYGGNRKDMVEILSYVRSHLVECPITMGTLKDLPTALHLMCTAGIAGRYVMKASPHLRLDELRQPSRVVLIQGATDEAQKRFVIATGVCHLQTNARRCARGHVDMERCWDWWPMSSYCRGSS